MPKIETAVRFVLLVIFSFSPVITLADTTVTAGAAMDPDKALAAIEKCDDAKMKALGTTCADWAQAIMAGFGGATNNCNIQAPKDFKENFDKLNKACGDALVEDCVKTVAQCLTPTKKTTKHTSQADPNAPLDIAGLKVDIAKCPPMANKDLESLQKQFKDQQDRVDKFQDALPDLQKQMNESLKDTQQQLQTLRQQALQDQQQHAQDLKDTSRRSDQAQQQVVSQIYALQTQISQATDAMSNIDIQALTAQAAFKQAKITIQEACYQQASDQVSKLQDVAIAEYKAGTWKRATSFTSFMRNAGTTDRVRWQRLAEKYYRWCMNSKPTGDSIEAANDKYSAIVKGFQLAKQSAQTNIAALQQQMLTLRDNKACGQTAPGAAAGETQLCQAARQATEDAQQAEASYQAKVQESQQQQMQIQQQGMQDYNTAKNQMTVKQQQLNNESKRLQNLQEYLQAKYAKGATLGADPKALSQAETYFGATRVAAQNIINCKRDAAIKAKSSGDFCKNQDQDCQNAINFLKTGHIDGASEEVPSTLISKADIYGPSASPDVPAGSHVRTPTSTGDAQNGPTGSGNGNSGE